MAATSDITSLQISDRETGSSRATRRLRREGKVPGVLYGQDRDNLHFAVDARELRNALAASGAVIELNLDGQTTPVVVKEAQKHPVRGEITHIDLVRVDLNQKITATVSIELTGAEDAPGVAEGGILEHVTREVSVEALPTDIPESIPFDVSGLNVNDTVTLDALTAPQGVTILDEGEETVLVTITVPTIDADAEEAEADAIEAETEVIGEVSAEAEDAGQGGEGDTADGDADSTPEA